MRLLITRPEPDAARTAQTLRARGHEVLVAPLTTMQALEADVGAESYGGILLTSANAARAAQTHSKFAEWRGIPAFTVGTRSARAAFEAGFEKVESADGALPDLVALAARCFTGNNRRLLYLAGEDRAGDLAAELATHGVAVDTAVIYRAVARNTLPDEALQALASGDLDGALHYSRRSAAIFLRLAGLAGALNPALSLAHYCLSDEVAAPLRDGGAGRIFVASHPDEAALLELVGT